MLIAARASGSMPFVFPTVNFDGKTLTDGGLFMNLDVAAAVSRCMETVSSHFDITIDIVLTNSYFFEEGDYSNSNSLSIAWRAYQAWKFSNNAKSIEYALTAFPDVNFWYVIRPKD